MIWKKIAFYYGGSGIGRDDTGGECLAACIWMSGKAMDVDALHHHISSG